MTEPAKPERRRTDYEVRVIFGLLGIIMCGLTWWMTKIDAKAERVPVLEEKVSSILVTMKEIQTDVRSLLRR